MTDSYIIGANRPRGKAANVTRLRPCLICGKPDWCLISYDGSEALCARIAEGAARTIKCKGGGLLHVHPLTGEQRRSLPPPPPYKPRAGKKTADQLQADHAQYLKAAEINPAPLVGVADQWKVPVAVLKGMGAGVDGNKCTLPELNPATHRISTFQFRIPGSKKKWGAKGGDRGFIYNLDNLKNGDGPVVIVEGHSDYAAARAMGLRVIGRWNNTADIPPVLLAECGDDAKFIFICERDKKDDGSHPGLTGPTGSAKAGANVIGGPVFCAFVPGCGSDYKDTCEYMNGEQAKAADPYHFDFKAAGQKFIDGLAETMFAVEPDPPKPAPRHMPLLNLGHAKMVDASVREQKRRECAKSIITKDGGIHVDTDPASAGGAAAFIYGAKIAEGRVTIIADSPQACEEIAKKGGADFGAYPVRNKDNCKNFGEIQKSRGYGGGMAASVCRTTCPISTGCAFWQKVDEVNNLRVRLAPKQRGGFQLDTLTSGCEAVLFLGNVRQVMLPMQNAIKDDFDHAETILKWIVAHAGEVGLSNDMREFCAECLIVTNGIIAKFGEADAARKVMQLNTAKRFYGDCGNWKDAVWKAVQTANEIWKVAVREGKNAVRLKPCGNAIEIAGDLVLGRLAEASIIAGWTEGEEKYMAANPEKAQSQLVAVRRNELPDAVVWASDPGASAYELERLFQRPIVDHTLGPSKLYGDEPIRPSSRLGTKHPVIQVARSIYDGTFPQTTCSCLRGVLRRNPGARRIGVIGHKWQIDAMFAGKKPFLDKASRDRVARYSWFGAGDVRSSDAWHLDCDLLVILGTPLRPMRALQEELVRIGKSDAAGRDGGRSEYVWEGETVDGDSTEVSTIGFADPDWQEVYRSTTQADLQMAVDLAHPYADVGGIPVVVVTCEPLGFPVAEDHWLEPIKESVVKAVEALVSLGNCGSTAEIARLLGKPERTVRRYLEAAEVLGWVIRVKGKRWWVDSGWYDFRPKILKEKENTIKENWPELSQTTTAHALPAPVVNAEAPLSPKAGQFSTTIALAPSSGSPAARSHASTPIPDFRSGKRPRLSKSPLVSFEIEMPAGWGVNTISATTSDSSREGSTTKTHSP